MQVEHKRKLVIDLTDDADEVNVERADKRVTICESVSDSDESDSDECEEDGNCCGICGSEYETREDTADVCLGCYESERNICHGCKEVFALSEFMDEEGEYCEGYCKECWPSVVDILEPVAVLIKS